jgi:succinoglycan biosynthesis protein ExoA
MARPLAEVSCNFSDGSGRSGGFDQVQAHASRDDGVQCTVLMPVLNEERHIARSVAAMRKQRFPGTLEFIVVDGGSTDRTREILHELAREDPRLRVFDNPRRIAASGLNVALRHARGRWVARMDAHAEYPQDYLSLGVQRLQRGDTRWVSGPPIATGEGRVSRAVSLALGTWLGRGGSRKWAVAERADAGAEYELDTGVFAGVWERSTLLRYGGWDEDWARSQDSEMAGRFLARDERLICIPAMAAEYTPRNSLRSLWHQYFQYGEYREMVAVRHPHAMRRSQLLPPALVTTVAAALVAPDPLRAIARAGLTVHAAALAAAGIDASRSSEHSWDAMVVPAVIAVMHLAYGVGAYRGALRNGPPLAAVARTVGLTGIAARLTPPEQAPFAPSLLAGRQATT